MFETVPVPVVFVSEIKAVSLTGVFQRGGTINEKHCVFDGVFLAGFSKESVGESVFSLFQALHGVICSIQGRWQRTASSTRR
jgi:hypothetical protein